MEFKDRTEYRETIGNYSPDLFHKLQMSLFLKQISKIEAGSEKWHLLQEKVSMYPDWGFWARKRAAFYMKTMSCGACFYAHTGVIMLYPQNITIGNNVSLNRNTMITAKAKVSIGNDVIIGPNVIINSGNHKTSNTKLPIRKQGHELTPIIIEDDVWIGANAVVLAGTTLGKGSVIGAGAVVTKNIEPYSIVGGVPAHQISIRGE